MQPTDADLDLTDRLPVLEPATDADVVPAAADEAAAAETAALRHSLEVARAEAGELGATGDSLRRALAFAHSEIAELTERVALREQELAALERARAARAAEANRAAPPPEAPPSAPPDPSLVAQLRDAQARCTRYLEALQSREWQRGVFEERVRALEDELEALRQAAHGFAEERARLGAEIESLRAELAARSAAPPAPEAPVAEPAAAAAEWRANTAAREAELEVERAARAAAERAVRVGEAVREQQAARMVELEAFAVSLGRALQVQTEAAHTANEQTAAHGRATAELRARIAELEDSLLAARRGAAVDPSANSAERSDLATRLEQAEQGARAAAAAAAAEVEALHSRQHDLVLQLERTRGALEERDLQIRRLERHLSRRDGSGAERPGGSDRDGDALVEPPAAASAALVPLDGSTPRLLERGRRTRIGRATDNDICIEDASVSRHHAIIVIGATGTFIEDLDSVNGVGVNGRRVRNAPLNEGDFITLGTMRFRFAAELRSAAQA